ncbi:NAD-dependent epimerase/dehydratase [Burkholderiales bacterium GJ-E10]|nr:NAD-dependent epimerase/dehydratase [Burkholderiales bacterium GJ-E10]
MQGKTALVTGLGGFTGGYLKAALAAKGCRVIGLSHAPSDDPDAMACDLTDSAAVMAAVQSVRPDFVAHLAAQTFVAHRDVEAFYRVNVLGTMNLLDALGSLDAPPQRVLLASSANVYGTPNVEVIDESVCPAPVSHYACSKLAMEHMARTWMDRLPIILVRPFNYTGPGQNPQFLVPKIVDHFRRGARTIELGNLDVSRDFSDVRDVVAAYVGLLESEAQSVTVNVCSGTDISLRAILAQMAEIVGYEIEVRVNPAFVRANEIPRLRGSNELLWRLISPPPARGLSETLMAMYQA